MAFAAYSDAVMDGHALGGGLMLAVAQVAQDTHASIGAYVDSRASNRAAAGNGTRD